MLLGMRQGLTGSDPSPVINWDFLQSQSLTSFSRTSNATLFDSTGKLTYAANNLLTYSNTFSDGAWGTTSGTTVAGGQSDPVGGSNASSLAFSGSSYHYQQTTLPAGRTYLFAAWIKGASASGTVGLRVSDGTGNANYNTVTLTTSWQLVSVYVTASLTSTGILCGFDNRTSFGGDSLAKTIYVYGATLSAVTYETTPRSQDQVITTTDPKHGPRYPYAYNGTTWDAQGLLVEAAATNNLQYSEAFDNGYWTKARVNAPEADAAISPSGVQNAEKVTVNGTTAPYVYKALSSFAASTYTFSVFAKKGTSSGWVYLVIGNGSTYYYAWFDLTNGAKGTTSGGGSGLSGAGHTITNCGNGWFRISISVITTSTYSLENYIGVDATGDGTENCTNANFNYFWGAQLEAGDLSSYIPNLATGTTQRNADTSLAFSAISLPTGLSFSRASNAMQYDAAGRLTYAPQNLAPYSEDINSWNKLGSPTIATNDTEGPFDATGTKTADKLTAGATGTFASYIYATYATAPTGPSIFSVYVKKVNQRYVFIDNYGGAGDFVAVFDLDTGTHVGNGGQTSPANVGISAVGTNGWYRIWLRRDNVGAALAIATATGNNTTQTSGDAVYIWGIQLENVTYETVARPYVANSTANAVYGPRYDYDPLTRLPKGLLIEEARTNYLQQSQNFGTTWATGETRAAASQMLPDGTTGGWSLTAVSTSMAQLYQATNTYSIPTGALTNTFIVKAGTANWVSLTAFDGGSRKENYFNISTGVSGTPAAGCTPLVKSLGNGWYQISVSLTVASKPNYIAISPVDADNSLNVTPGKSIFLYSSQIEAGSFPTSYIPNPGIASGIRSADVATLTGTASTIASASDGTMLIETDAMQTGSTDQILFGNLLKDQLYRMAVGGSLNKVSNYQFRTAGTSTTNTATWTAPVRASVAYSANAISVCLQGGAVATGTGNLTMSGSTYVGSDGSGTQVINGYVRKVGMWNVKLADAKLQTKSVVGATL